MPCRAAAARRQRLEAVGLGELGPERLVGRTAAAGTTGELLLDIQHTGLQAGGLADDLVERGLGLNRHLAGILRSRRLAFSAKALISASRARQCVHDCLELEVVVGVLAGVLAAELAGRECA